MRKWILTAAAVSLLLASSGLLFYNDWSQGHHAAAVSFALLQLAAILVFVDIMRTRRRRL